MKFISVLLFVIWNSGDSFVVEASARIMYDVNVSRDDLRLFVDDIGLFERHMDGVVGVEALGEDIYLYKTSRYVFLKGRMDVDFVIEKTVANDTLTIYRTPDVKDPNWLECRVELRSIGKTLTSIDINLRLRMQRSNGYEVHWLAPVVGAGFVGDRMEEELEAMLYSFAESSSQELSHRFENISRKQQ